jgi:AcrR family transcriptional regulator
LSPTLTREEKRERTRRALLDAAAKLFRKHGLEGTSIDMLAAEAGFTKGAFYAHFDSKEDLYLVLLDERFDEQLGRLEQTLSGEQGAAEEARRGADLFLTTAVADDEWKRLYFEFVAYATRNAPFREKLAERHRALRERLTQIYSAWGAGFDVEPPIPVADIAAMTDFMADGYLLNQMIDRELDPALYTNMLLVYMRGLQAMTLGWEPPAETFEPGEGAR